MIESAEFMMTLIRSEIESIDDSMMTRCESFKLMMTISRFAAHEFAESLKYHANEFKYYFSDSSLDEIGNPAMLIGDIASLMNQFYEGEAQNIINEFRGIMDQLEYDIESLEEDGFMFDSFANAIDAFESIFRSEFEK